jgi:hypothetical protein
MASYPEIAPELSKVILQSAAVAFAQNVLEEADPPVMLTITDLGAPLQSAFLQWLQWFGREKRPAGLPAWINWSPKRVATKLGMSESYVRGLLAERSAIIAEVDAFDANAFKAHASITSVSYTTNGDLTVMGKEFLSVAGGAMGVRMVRPDGPTITRTKVQVEAGGGTFTDTNVVVKAASLPGVLLTGDLVTIVADGLDSNVVALVIAEVTP